MTDAPASVGILCSFGARTGYGHLRRCLTLAAALYDAGSAISFYVATDDDLGVISDELGIYNTNIVKNISAVRLIQHYDLLVIDSYESDLELEHRLMQQAGRVLVLEDLPNRAHAVDMILDPTVGRVRGDYDAVLPDACGGLFGPRYALIRSAFRRGDNVIRPALPHILIAFGGTDPGNATGQVLRALDGMAATVDIVLGGSAPHLASVRQQASGHARLHVDIDGDTLAGLMHRAHLCIGAGGGGAWERCAAGVPTLAYEIIDNQRDVLASLSAAGALDHGGRIDQASDAEIQSRVTALLADVDRCARLAQHGMQLCDGRGAARVAAWLAQTTAKDGRLVRLRPVAPVDRNRILTWQSAPGARRFARNTAVPTADEHARWFARRLSQSGAPFAMVEVAGEAAGFVRLDRAAETDGADFEVAILIAQAFTGLGIGQAALRLASHLEPGAALVAEVLPDNAASKALFRAVGFDADGADHWRFTG